MGCDSIVNKAEKRSLFMNPDKQQRDFCRDLVDLFLKLVALGIAQE